MANLYIKLRYSAPCWPSPVVTAFILMSLQRRYLKATGSESVSWRQYVQYTLLRSRQTGPGSGVQCALPEARTSNTMRFNTGQPYARCPNQRVRIQACSH